MIGAAAALLLGLAAQPATVPPGEPETEELSASQPVRLTPLPIGRAFAAFRDICMAGFPDPDTFNRAAAAADLGFVRNRGNDRTIDYSSRHGQIVMRHGRDPRRVARRERETRVNRRERRALAEGVRERWVARCDFWVAVEERLEPEALVAAVTAGLAPETRPVEEIIGYSWTLAPPAGGGTLRLALLPTDADPRIFTLSLQWLVAAPAR